MQTPEVGTVMVNKANGLKYIVRRIESNGEVTLARMDYANHTETMPPSQVESQFQSPLFE